MAEKFLHLLYGMALIDKHTARRVTQITESDPGKIVLLQNLLPTQADHLRAAESEIQTEIDSRNLGRVKHFYRTDPSDRKRSVLILSLKI